MSNRRPGSRRNPLRDEPVLPCRPQHAGRLAAVAGDATAYPQLLERHPAPVVGEDHPETGGAALRRLHLQDGGHRAPPPAPAIEVPSQTVVAAQNPSTSLSRGTTRVIGGWLSVLTSTPASVPEVSVSFAAFGDVQAKPLAVEGSGVRITRPA